MRPILMKGHERPLTFLKYNRDGDLLFSCAKDHKPIVWYADNGERLGTYSGHNGAVWSCDVSWDSSRLITASADQTVKLWDLKRGEELHTFKFDSPARSVDFSTGDKLAVIITDPFMEKTSAIHVYRIAEDLDEQSDRPVLVIKGPNGRINRAVWGPLNNTIISCGEDAIIRVWDPVTGQEMMSTKDHKYGHTKAITSICLSADKSHFLTGSLDKLAKLWDTRTLTLLKSYSTEQPVNAVTMSPLLDHVVLGGGIEASLVPIVGRAGKFEAKFFDKSKVLLQVLLPVIVFFSIVGAFCFWRWRCRPSGATNNATEATEDETEIEDASRLQLARFTYSQVKDMTNDFNRMLGEGGYGIVYYGRLSDNHREVAVKVLSENDAPKQFSNEVQVNVLGRIHHKNLVTLIGFCEEGTSNLALVYEYLSGGDLKDLSEHSGVFISWKRRLAIAFDTAQGLDYLHTGCSPPIVHRDVKPANILLNQHYHQAKVADFGFSKIFPAENVSKLKTRVIGTTAYLAPQYHLTGQVNERSDVYSFGVVLLELMTGKSAIRKNTHPFNLMGNTTL
ncbi:eukaryotic translation initiation factor 3 subunit I-like isoform X2 [Chenopodium quinoa]|uniref:eukaryotic translation initiation factor 3 subunit I-like isoform X2 n=1 Tax=Chenopodium quinoa TaxID=63459 RepID=UPI000B7763E3|nr:eukaryotic translation initiation factor 3 subunit I-like isoform X2 [Chenopodium quinoa]